MRLWLLVLAVWSAGWCLTAAPRLGVTYDEPFYLNAGMDSWRGWKGTEGKAPRFAHEYAATNGVMPLPPDALTLPVFVQEVRAGEEFESEETFARLRWARAVTLGWLWLLVVSAWRLGRAAGGPWAGRIAAGVLATDPNFLGHASLATTDIAVTAALVAFARAVYAGRLRWVVEAHPSPGPVVRGCRAVQGFGPALRRVDSRGAGDRTPVRHRRAVAAHPARISRAWAVRAARVTLRLGPGRSGGHSDRLGGGGRVLRLPDGGRSPVHSGHRQRPVKRTAETVVPEVGGRGQARAAHDQRVRVPVVVERQPARVVSEWHLLPRGLPLVLPRTVADEIAGADLRSGSFWWCPARARWRTRSHSPRWCCSCRFC